MPVRRLRIWVKRASAFARNERQRAPFPENGYQGEYIKDIAVLYKKEFAQDGANENLDAMTKLAVRELRKEQDLDLRAFDVAFESYFLESSLYSDGSVQKTVDMLVAQGATYEQDGALWLKTTPYGDDKDRVMRKSDGSFTYFVPDVAYHVEQMAARLYPRGE